MRGRLVVAVFALVALSAVAAASFGLAMNSVAHGCSTTETTEVISGRSTVVQGFTIPIKQPDEVHKTTVQTCR